MSKRWLAACTGCSVRAGVCAQAAEPPAASASPMTSRRAAQATGRGRSTARAALHDMEAGTAVPGSCNETFIRMVSLPVKFKVPDG